MLLIMPHLRFSVTSLPGESHIELGIDRLWNGGWASRDPEETQRHVDELRQMGVAPPTRTPIFFPLSSNLATTSDCIQVIHHETSGEIEFALLFGPECTYVTVASDHSDRMFERHGIQISKQLCPNILAPRLWPYDECSKHWDQLILRCYVTKAGSRSLYQEAQLKDLISADAWLELLDRSGVVSTGLVFLSGTPPTKSGIVFGDAYEIELHDPVLERSIEHRYSVEVLGPGEQ